MTCLIHHLHDLHHLVDKVTAGAPCPQGLSLFATALSTQQEKELCQLVQRLPTLHYLSISQQSIESLLNHGLDKALHSLSDLQHLNLSRNLCTSSGLALLGKALEEMPHHPLFISLNSPLVGADFRFDIGRLIEQSSIKNLSLSLYPQPFFEEKKLEVETLQLGAAEFSVKDADKKIKYYENYISCRHLQISGFDGSFLHQGFESPWWACLQTLIARRIQIPASLLNTWFSLLSQGPLHSLCLAHNTWLASGSYLQSLKLTSFCDIDLSFCRLDLTSSGLSSFLIQNPKITALNLEGNTLLVQHWDALLNILTELPWLHTLNLSHIPLQSEHLKSLVAFIKEHPQLTSIDLSATHLQLEQGEILFDLIESQPYLFINMQDNALPLSFLLQYDDLQQYQYQNLKNLFDKYQKLSFQGLDDDISAIFHRCLFSYDPEIEKVFPFIQRQQYIQHLGQLEKYYPAQEALSYLKHVHHHMNSTWHSKFGFHPFIPLGLT